jgi:outer membrane biosynthesis protein TonB
MTRLQKKCVILSTGMHLSLAAILFVGPAFSSKKTEDIREINFVPTLLVDANVQGGGNPNARPPASPNTQQPTPQPPPPKPEIKPQSQPKPETEKITASDPNDFSERKPRKPQIVTKLETRSKPVSRRTDTTSDDKAQQQQVADARRKAAQELARAAEGIRDGAASATAIDVDPGPGGGGPAYAGYASWVQSVYQSAWVAPDDTATDAPITKARVTIASDGHVLSSEIISRSGDSQMDSSVQRTLDRVTTVGRPFPDGVKDKQRTYILKFDLKVKRGLA